MTSESEQLNKMIKFSSSTVYSLLSKKGKEIYFPKKGIFSQTGEANGKGINATIGTALEEDNSTMCLGSLSSLIALPSKKVFPYESCSGNKELREKRRTKGSLPLVTNGLTHALSIVGYLFVEEGDEIIIPDLYWENYDLIFTRAYGSVFNTFPCFKNGTFNINGLKDKLKNDGKKILFFNFPNNPSGYTPSTNEVQEIISAIKECAERGCNILVIVDDAYYGLVYEESYETKSLYDYLVDLHEYVLAVKIDGASKEDFAWGFRVGFLTFCIKNGKKELYDALENKGAGVIRGSISNVPNLCQSLLLEVYKSENYEKEKEEKRNILKSRYEEVKRILKNEKYSEFFEQLPNNSGYFMCVKLKKGLNAERIRKKLLEKYDTGVICFDNLIRIAYSSVPKEKLEQLFDNLHEACSQ